MSVISEIDSIITLLEAQIPANQESPKNQRLKNSFQREMAKYFKSLEQAFPFKEIERIYNRHVRPD